MIRYLYAHQLDRDPAPRASMYRDRAEQFKARLGWNVEIDASGEERDVYDAENPLYVIWQGPDGRHGGSMRLLPTTGPTMVNDHFRHLTDGVRIESPLIWECTRFCLGQSAAPGTAAALMLAGGEVMRHFGVRHFVGVFDARMVRIYRMIGASPEVLGRQGAGRDAVNVGLWEFSAQTQARVSARAGICAAQSAAWFEMSFTTRPRPAVVAA
ncbi:acyl-homoserine-lactone synthase [Aestuariicoccus sp. MJ-SS9]|uniref:acyl-homoserine-lactone synthase n=1 Tax=Aestuariicoccus sp. MJ-SS9 TaxID=3079855 RepID=UPI00290D1FB0|nr:acyl-homoserine-lactone synthase [Aestuariicoccus sp. MJ-SS9]MDU8909869.1 acyl-homoserine-lactone synthase [Aestuariicoccus sp. MJ-SS9]